MCLFKCLNTFIIITITNKFINNEIIYLKLFETKYPECMSLDANTYPMKLQRNTFLPPKMK